MKARTDEEIAAKVLELWPGVETVPITRFEKSICVRVTKQYDWGDAPSLTFEKLDELAKFFDTMNVETESEISSQGCETCDYGSEYGFELGISDGLPYADVGQHAV